MEKVPRIVYIWFANATTRLVRIALSPLTNSVLQLSQLYAAFIHTADHALQHACSVACSVAWLPNCV